MSHMASIVTAYIGLGSNLGDREMNIQRALEILHARDTRVIAVRDGTMGRSGSTSIPERRMCRAHILQATPVSALPQRDREGIGAGPHPPLWSQAHRSRYPALPRPVPANIFSHGASCWHAAARFRAGSSRRHCCPGYTSFHRANSRSTPAAVAARIGNRTLSARIHVMIEAAVAGFVL
jgi:hypothetical protein